jgi:hypothetical protein
MQRFARAMLMSVVLGAAWATTVRSETFGKAVEFQSSDAKTATAESAGKGTTAIIFCHDRVNEGAGSWIKAGRHLRDERVQLLALNFRGYPSEAPPDLPGKEYDLLGAFDYVVQRGATNIFVCGVGLGAEIALKALPTLDTMRGFRGIAVVSAHDAAAAEKSTAGKLFVVSGGDAANYGPTMEMASRAAAPKRLIVYTGDETGQELMEAHREEILDALMTMVRYAAAP